MRLRWLTLLLGLAAFGSVGCKDLHYFDVTVRFDGASFTGNAQSKIETCHVYVTGADTDDFYIRNPGQCLGTTTGLTLGTFEYSSNADSGALTFTLKAYSGVPEDTQCLFGQGAVTIPIGATTVTGELVVVQMGVDC
jgi:hypothetical protein